MADPELAHSAPVFKNNFKNPPVWPTTVTEWHRRNNFPPLPNHSGQELFETAGRHPGGCLKHLHRTGRCATGLLGDGFLVGTTHSTPKQGTARGIRTLSAPASAGQLTYRFCRSKQKPRLLISELLHQHFFH